MGNRHKSTAGVLDQIIQVIWHYQQLHHGATPNYSLIEIELGLEGKGNRISHHIQNLVNDGRLDKHHIRPFRATILKHPKNDAAIRRFKKWLDKQDAPEVAADPKPVVERAVTEPEPPEQMSPPPVAEIPAAPPMTRPGFSLPYPRPKTLWEAEQNLVAVGVDPQTVIGRDVITLPTIKTAPTGMLLEELLERGYCVSKAR